MMVPHERCIDCGAERIGGELPFSKMLHNGRDVYRCFQCANALAWMLWPEDWGPNPHYPSHRAGHA